MGLLVESFLVLWGAMILVGLWVSFVRGRAPRARRAGTGFPLVPVAPLLDGGPGRYLITGVEAATSRDVKTVIEAETLANAKVKAELRGVVVTDIVKQ
jgi:hypothetical protein